MGGFSLIHWVLVIGVVMILFGKGRISDVMGDVAKGIRSFRKGLNEEDAAAPRLPETAPPVDVTPRDAHQDTAHRERHG